jgi:hypothetical protein
MIQKAVDFGTMDWEQTPFNARIQFVPSLPRPDGGKLTPIALDLSKRS